MLVPKVSCPECSTVLRPAKPLAVGKKVRCPRCETVFTVSKEDEVETSRKPAAEKKSAKSSSSKGGAGKPAAKTKEKKEEAPKKKEGEDEIGVYGWVKDPDLDVDEEDDQKGKKSKKPKIDYAPDMSIKDLRGPAVAILMSPSNQLSLVGFLGFIGWLILMVLLIIPAVFPIKDDKAGLVMGLGRGLGNVDPEAGNFSGMKGFRPIVNADADKQKFEEERPSFYEMFGFDVSMLCELPWYTFWLSMIPFVVLMCCSGLVAYGAIKMQNLESRAWGITGCIMAMLPFSCGGLQAVTMMVVQYGLGMIIDDYFYIGVVASVFSGAEWVASIAIGIWALTTLMKPEVIAGFEYVAE